MKLIFVVVAILGFANASPTNRGISEVWQEIQALLPLDDIKALTVDYYNRGAFNKILNVIHGQDWSALVAKYEANDYVQRAIAYLQDSGIDTAALWETAKSYAARLPTATDSDATATSLEFLSALKDLLPLADIKAFWQEKKASNEWLQNLVARMYTPEFQELCAKVAASDAAQNLVQHARDNGWPIDEYAAKIRDWFGW